MGKATGFMEHSRETRDAPSGDGTRKRLVRDLPGFLRRKTADSRRALHGLRSALLPDRVSGEQPYS